MMDHCGFIMAHGRESRALGKTTISVSFGIGGSAISVETAWLWLLIGEIAFRERENATKN
jgi:hypothetical protein